MIELGYFTALLGRSRVALCRFDQVELAADLSSLTYIALGAYPASTNEPILNSALTKLKDWVTTIPDVAPSVPTADVLHGYTGRWHLEMSFKRWRDIDINPPNYVSLNGYLDLIIEPSGMKGFGFAHGDLSIKIGDCQAEFKVTDKVDRVECTDRGELKFCSSTYSRQRVRLEGIPPQQNGFDDEIAGPRVFPWHMKPSSDAPRQLIGHYMSGSYPDNIHSETKYVKATRSSLTEYDMSIYMLQFK